MPSIYQLKPAFQRLLRPLAQALVKLGVTANQVTSAAMLLSLATGVAVALFGPTCPGVLLLLPAVLFVRMGLNAIDGMMAREHGQATPVGAILNELGDVISDAGLYLPTAALAGFPWALVALLVVLGTLTEMTGVMGQTLGAGRRYDGPMGKSDRAFVFGALGLALGLGAPAGAWVGGVLVVAILLSAATVVNRARKALEARS